ncbi:hypothetical protein O77CONTIG1_04900 [Leptolyngbya sp. O-77]|nr:hypothetical protein O77CONTIG1_04900 [Leptolyngbya sp. O-77]
MDVASNFVTTRSRNLESQLRIGIFGNIFREIFLDRTCSALELFHYDWNNAALGSPVL